MSKESNENKRPFCYDDLFKIKGVGSPKLSPDGSHVICVVTIPDEYENAQKEYITLIGVEDKTPQFLMPGASPIWAPDGLEIAYEASEEGLDGIWIYNLATKKKRFLVPVYHSAYFINHLEAKNFAWSPDGTYIAYVSTFPFSESDTEEKEVRVIKRLLYKTKGGRGRPFFADDYLTHIWIVPAAGGEPELITSGHYNEHSICWSPDSSQLAFISNRSDDPDNNQYDDLWRVSIQSKQVIRLTNDLGTAFTPSWSPDGNYIAYLATTSVISTNDSPADDTHLYLIGASGGAPRCLTTQLDRRIESISWHPKGAYIYFTAGNHGRTPLYRVAVSSASVEPVIEGDFHVLEYALSKNGEAMVYVRTAINHPAEVFLMKGDQQNSIQVTHQNDRLLQTCYIQDAETFWFKSFDGTSVQGWLMKPVIFSASEMYPLVLVIHGGPHNMFGYDFEERMQLLSAHGYAVLFINPRGSSGYGQAFSRGCVLNWGGGDYKDLMSGLDFILEKYQWIDKERLGVTGQSYGGYMTNWIITQTNRFKAAVVDGGISNLISFSGTSLYHSLMESEFNGSMYDNYPLLWQWSPLRNVKKVITPTLFLHGEKDNEVPVSQAEEMYVALKKLGVPTMFVQYVGEGHGWRPELKPKNRIDLLSRMIQWFNENVKST